MVAKRNQRWKYGFARNLGNGMIRKYVPENLSRHPANTAE
jgi:hypothetical protein